MTWKDETNWEVVADLGLKASDDAMEAIKRTVFLADNALDATLISMVAVAVVRARHEATVEAMEASPTIQSAKALADDVYKSIKAQRSAELQLTMPILRRLLNHARRGGPKGGSKGG